MPNRLKPLNVVDFTGGINLRPETFQLLDNELPELLNMEVDPRGGINTRKGWAAEGGAIAAGTWDPRNAFMHRTAADIQWVYVVNDHDLYARSGAGAWTNIAAKTCLATPHQADFATWGDDVFVARGWNQVSIRVNGATVTPFTSCASGNWQNDYTSPGSTDTMPQAELVSQHAGYMFAACTGEDGAQKPNRLRWSHPNNPRRWASADYIDVVEGGQRITAIIPFSDRLLIFKPDSVWALFGYDSDTWEVTNISRSIGCANQQCVARNEAAVFWLSWPQGIFAYNEKANVEELSVQIRTIFQDHKMDPSAIVNSWLGWVGRRLWCSLPYNDIPPPDAAETVFVFDPVLSSWTMFRGAENCVPGPYIERVEVDQEDAELAVARTTPYLLALDAESYIANDECTPGMPMPFATRMRTRWLDAGNPTWKKSWRRPDFLLRALTIDSTVNVQVFHDFDAYNAERSFIVEYTPDNPLALWGEGWLYKATLEDGGTKYGGSDQTSSVERGGTMGRAGVVQLLIYGFESVTWGLNGIIFKFIPRRFR